MKPLRVALVSSIGGHLAELLELLPALRAAGAEPIWILNDDSPVLPREVPAWLVAHAERDLRVVKNLVEFAAIFARERPDAMLSLGAGPAVPAAIIARLAGIPVLYVEPSSAVTAPTLTGRLMRWLATDRWAQWPAVAKKLRARLDGALL
ncbi:MAG: hypothetical protein IT385_14480 [Deltaproteobacteria bacterium]|nr:hypothetical protein [Deltaproteobacteria bacterium]